MGLPAAYAWLGMEPGPKMLTEALKQLGTVEIPGTANSPVIMGWAKELGLTSQYSQDSIPWCGLFLAIVAKRAGKPVVASPLWALNWAKFGTPVTVGDAPHAPALGDVLTFKRDGGGHVALYVGEDSEAFHVIGGNQSDAVTITRIAKARLHAARRPIYAVGQPANVRVIKLAPTGGLSNNEA